MKPFVPKEKMSKKARKKLAAGKRGTWSISPVTRKIDSKKVYNRKRISRADTDDGAGDPLFGRGKRASGGRCGRISGAALPACGTGRRTGGGDLRVPRRKTKRRADSRLTFFLRDSTIIAHDAVEGKLKKR